ncbi:MULTISPECIES: glycosyltransferase family 4 protein [Roseomonadaceae]|uniref:Glycosyltransferase family 4 protein n=1 Tax=Falsiroseomonas oleicola TaxID=2801474 RepID=A0ABS6H4E6_9PROT|nr:glycosyltransferase family 1 protein [Roseomonas oleicola]MBU8542603.1 glycosyltransferase family 4 protein [Roseomonas oleicola]
MHVFLDISRLLTVAHRPAPSGIDRVEMAYARHWMLHHPQNCTFVAEVPLLGFAALPLSLVRELVAALEESWESGTRLAANAARRARLALPFGRPAMNEALRKPGPKSFLLVSHRALERPGRIAAMRRNGCHFVPLIHDLIPLQHPEFARDGQAERHKRRIVTTAALADGIIVNSAATAEELAPWLSARNDRPLIAVAPLGVSPSSVDAPPVSLRPYFVALGTIEPRKNHLLLLNLWRQFANAMGGAAPRLVVVGRRGWENENVLDMLERCSALDGLVRESGSLPDREVASLLRGARALLFPSFAEGFGLPLAESLALGVPALASDLPALREVGRKVPDYLDPLDGPAWRNAVLDYARPDSPGRRAQLSRLTQWRPPSWDEHFIEVEQLFSDLVRRPTEPLAPRVSEPHHDMVRRGTARRDEGMP